MLSNAAILYSVQYIIPVQYLLAVMVTRIVLYFTTQHTVHTLLFIILITHYDTLADET